ncbi:polypeptide N-acetylgalactosaminyltransferase 5, partial [Trichonephila inaurata madagascariensis]
ICFPFAFTFTAIT